MSYCLADYLTTNDLPSDNCYFTSDINILTLRGLRDGFLTFILYLYVYYVKIDWQNITAYINQATNGLYTDALRIFTLDFQFTYAEGERLFRYWFLQ